MSEAWESPEHDVAPPPESDPEIQEEVRDHPQDEDGEDDE